jgi:predicted RNase H-like HicB family nuclease
MYLIETELEDDGRWIAEIASVPGVMSYGNSREDAVRNVQALCLRVLADRLENGEQLPNVTGVFEVVA